MRGSIHLVQRETVIQLICQMDELGKYRGILCRERKRTAAISIFVMV